MAFTILCLCKWCGLVWLCRVNSYSHLSDIVDHLFPPRRPSCSDDTTVNASCLPGASQYSSFTYWRNPLPDLDNDIADFIQTRDTSATDKNADTKKIGMAGKKAASLPASATAKTADSSKTSTRWTALSLLCWCCLHLITCIPLWCHVVELSPSR